MSEIDIFEVFLSSTNNKLLFSLSYVENFEEKNQKIFSVEKIMFYFKENYFKLTLKFYEKIVNLKTYKLYFYLKLFHKL